jgi:hypothetical protein
LYTFRARGHPNIVAGHATTLMVTRDERLTRRGDCVVAVGAEASLVDLPEDMKAAARSSEATVSLTIEVGGESFTVKGRGHPDLTYSSELDVVARRSRYTCGRTLMVESNAAASDIPRSTARLLRSQSAEIKVTLRVKG